MSEKEFSVLWLRHRERLYRSALAYLRGDSYLADDALGGTLLTLLRQREKMPAEGANGFLFLAHARKILKYALSRTLTTQNRTKRKGVTVSLDVVTREGELCESRAVMRQAVERQRGEAAQAQESARLRRALSAVDWSEQEAQAFAMKRQGDTGRDMAQALGVSTQAASLAWLRAVKRLRWADSRLEAQDKDDGSSWTGEQLHAWGSAVSIAG